MRHSTEHHLNGERSSELVSKLIIYAAATDTSTDKATDQDIRLQF